MAAAFAPFPLAGFKTADREAVPANLGDYSRDEKDCQENDPLNISSVVGLSRCVSGSAVCNLFLGVSVDWQSNQCSAEGSVYRANELLTNSVKKVPASYLRCCSVGC
jgi:hypothetical protein